MECGVNAEMKKKIKKPVEISAARFDIGSKIKELRHSYGDTGLSQAELAHYVGTTPNTVSRWETGIYTPSIDDIVRLAHFFNIPFLTFFPTQDPSPQITALIVATRDMNNRDIEDVIQYARFRHSASLKVSS